jgi:pimeloyl-ACP methyl ester carboxylesterase
MHRKQHSIWRQWAVTLAILSLILVVASVQSPYASAQPSYPPLTPIPIPPGDQPKTGPAELQASPSAAQLAAVAGIAWGQVTPATSPSARAQMGFVYDEARGVVVATGGNNNFTALNETWEYDGTTWTKRTLSGGPGGRNRPAVAYDPVRRVTVLFGGSLPGDQTFFNDTWEYDGVSWRRRNTVNAPLPRNGAAMAYDANRGVMVLFGGYRYQGGFNFYNDTWEYDGLQWTQRTPVERPQSRETAGMAYDAGRGVTVLFGGGRSAGSTTFNDTWEWDGSTWRQRSPTLAPAARWAHTLTYDTRRNRMILFGGLTGNTSAFNDTWEYDGVNWAQIVTPMSPAARWDHGMVYDPARDTMVLFGGVTFQSDFRWYSDTWRLTVPKAEVQRPVVFLPGFGGSALQGRRAPGCQGDEKEIWVNLLEFKVSGDDNLLRRLILAANGVDAADQCDMIVADRVLERLSIPFLVDEDIYDTFLRRLRADGFTVEPCPYDWRRSVLGDGPTDLPQRLDECVRDALARHGGTQVDIVAHSTGGLVARQYLLSSPARAAKVNTVVSIGTPYLGTLKTFLMLRSGQTLIPQLDEILNDTRIMEVSRNAPSVYQLLPAPRFFDYYPGYYVTVTNKFNTFTSHTAMSDFLRREYNADLVNAANRFHSGKIGDWRNDGLSVRYFAFVGTGVDTPRWLMERVEQSREGDRVLHIPLNEPRSGDGTVLQHSGDLGGAIDQFTGNATICSFANTEHGALPNANAVLTALGNVLRGQPVSEGNCVRSVPPVNPAAVDEPVSSRQLVVTGLGQVHIYDEQGRHTGPVASGLVENQIPLVTYLPGGGVTSVGLPPVSTYTITVTMSDTTPLDIRLLRTVKAPSLEQAIAETVAFADVLAVPGGAATIRYNPLAEPDTLRLVIDHDRDGTPESTREPSAVLDARESTDWTAPVSSVAVQGRQDRLGFFTGSVTVTIQAADAGSGVATIEYSRDGGVTFERYSGPFSVIAEQVPRLLVVATDRAGNKEYPWLERRLQAEHAWLPLLRR